MMKSMLLIVILAVYGSVGSAVNNNKYVTVAVIDTGLREDIMMQGYAKGICKMGHRDFTGKGIHDDHGHGTNISGLIHQYAKGLKYCQVILKFHIEDADGEENMTRMVSAIQYAVNIKVDFINISAGGSGISAIEEEAVMQALDNGITVVTAAGNEECNLDKKECEYFPAIYDKRIVVVGNGITEEDRTPSSNWGSAVDFWIDGNSKKGEYGGYMSGTSQSTAIQTGKLVRKHVQSRRHTKDKPKGSRATIRRL